MNTREIKEAARKARASKAGIPTNLKDTFLYMMYATGVELGSTMLYEEFVKDMEGVEGDMFLSLMHEAYNLGRTVKN